MENLQNSNENEKLEKVRDLLDFVPEVVFDLVGGMKNTPQKGRHESGSFKTADENSKKSTGVALATGGKDRMLTMAFIHEAFPSAQLVTMSKTSGADPSAPTYAAMTRDELIRKGVPSKAILMEEISVSTITEYIAAAKLWKEYHWKNIVFVTSNWHIPRSEALLNHIRDLVETEDQAVVDQFALAIQSGEVRVQFIGSTELLCIKDDRYKRLFKTLEEDPGMIARIETEEKALSQIAGGDYNRRNLLQENKIWKEKK